MKTPRYARIVFGASAVLFGIIALMWHDVATWQALARIWSLPFGAILGNVLMIAQIAGGVALIAPRSLRTASIVLCVVYLLFSLASVPDIIAAPQAYEHYGSFFEQFSLLCGALALVALTDADSERSTALAQTCRIGLGLSAVSFTLAQIFYLRLTAELVPRWIPPGQMFWAVLTTIAFAIAAAAILVNRRARLAMRLTGLMVALFGVLVWVPRLVRHPQSHFNWSEFALTALIAGAAWTVADAPFPTSSL